MELLDRAYLYAAEAHRLDTRKGGTVPYVAHLLGVASLVLEHGGDEEQAAAALLHDVVEDHGGQARLDDVRAQFGEGVAAIVADCSDSLVDTTAGEEKAPWRPRKEAYLDHLATVPERSLLVTAADKLYNARSLLIDHRVHGAVLWDRFNAPDAGAQVWYYGALAEVVARRLGGPLADELARTVDELATRVAEE